MYGLGRLFWGVQIVDLHILVKYLLELWGLIMVSTNLLSTIHTLEIVLAIV